MVFHAAAQDEDVLTSFDATDCGSGDWVESGSERAQRTSAISATFRAVGGHHLHGEARFNLLVQPNLSHQPGRYPATSNTHTRTRELDDSPHKQHHKHLEILKVEAARSPRRQVAASREGQVLVDLDRDRDRRRFVDFDVRRSRLIEDVSPQFTPD